MKRSADEQLMADLVHAVNEFSAMVNAYDTDYDTMAEIIVQTFQTKHRTLQQGMVRFMVKVIHKLNEHFEAGFSTDLRNEEAARWIAQASKIDPYIPHI